MKKGLEEFKEKIDRLIQISEKIEALGDDDESRQQVNEMLLQMRATFLQFSKDFKMLARVIDYYQDVEKAQRKSVRKRNGVQTTKKD